MKAAPESLMRASQHLNLTQPTVGRRLTAMEQRFGTPLFVRAGRRMQLALVAGEASGDLLASVLLGAVKARWPRRANDNENL